MIRNILVAIVGYIAMVAVVIAGMGIAWQVLGPGLAFDGQGPYPSTTWIGFSIVFGFLGAAVGGNSADGDSPCSPKKIETGWKTRLLRESLKLRKDGEQTGIVLW